EGGRREADVGDDAARGGVGPDPERDPGFFAVRGHGVGWVEPDLGGPGRCGRRWRRAGAARDGRPARRGRSGWLGRAGRRGVAAGTIVTAAGPPSTLVQCFWVSRTPAASSAIVVAPVAAGCASIVSR